MTSCLRLFILLFTYHYYYYYYYITKLLDSRRELRIDRRNNNFCLSPGDNTVPLRHCASRCHSYHRNNLLFAARLNTGDYSHASDIISGINRKSACYTRLIVLCCFQLLESNIIVQLFLWRTESFVIHQADNNVNALVMYYHSLS